MSHADGFVKGLQRSPTMFAECGCPYDPEYDEGSLGWHLTENHIPERIDALRRNLQGMLNDLDRLEGALRRRTDIYDTTPAEGGGR